MRENRMSGSMRGRRRRAETHRACVLLYRSPHRPEKRFFMSEQPNPTSDNVLTKLHDLLLYIIPQLGKFPRDQKFQLADRIEVKLLDVQECCLRAYYSKEKVGHLREANMGVELARHLVRLSFDLKLINTHRYGVISEKLDEVGRMIGGWLRSVAER